MLLFVYRCLFMTSLTTPYRLALSDNSNSSDLYYYGWLVTDMAIDFLFFIDVIFNFFSAYYDDNFVIVDNKNVKIALLHTLSF